MKKTVARTLCTSVALGVLTLTPAWSHAEAETKPKTETKPAPAEGEAGSKPGGKEKAAPSRVEPGSGFEPGAGFSNQPAAKGKAGPPAARTARTERSDYTRTINPGDGFWGDWQQEAMCPPGQFADAFQMRVEQPQGDGDDTALNAVYLACSPVGSKGRWTWISSHDGFWGGNGFPGICGVNEWLTGAVLKLEGKQGNGDDTAANAVAGVCSNADHSFNYRVHGDNPGQWGTWQQPAHCSKHEAICGLQTRVEAKQGSKKDDTAMNGVRFFCCKLP